MAPEPLLNDVADAVLDCSPVNWSEVEAQADASATAIVKHLQVLSIVAGVHRNQATDTRPARPGDVAGESWGHLRLLERIGRGAFGEVYRAWDPRLDRDVALKLLPAPAANGSTSSIIEEGRLLARVRHPGVVTIHGAEQIGDRIGLWMELVRGRTLEDLLETGSTFTAAEVIHIGVELSRAVHAVHHAGLLHRDIKAQNVMRADDGRVVLMDFGTGRELTDSGSDLTGTPLYLAPEVFAGQPASVQSDVYSLGVLLFRLATGTYPVRGQSIRDVRSAHERAERVTVGQVQPKIQPRLGRLIDQMVDRRPEQRPQTADAIAASLAKIDRRVRMRPLVLAASLVATLAIAGAVTWAWGPFTSSHAPQTRGVRPSIEVLPLANTAARDEDSWLSLALAEMLLREFRGSEAFRWIPAAPQLAVAQLGGLTSAYTTYQISWNRPPVPADIVVSGEYRVSGQSGQPGELQVIVRLEDKANGQPAIVLSDVGSPADIRGLMSGIGSRARAALGVADLSPAQASALAASQPANTEAARAYAEGLAANMERARAHAEWRATAHRGEPPPGTSRVDVVEAMERAIAADDRFAPAYTALSEALTDADLEKATAAAARAVELAVHLPREERLLIQIRSLQRGRRLFSEAAEKLFRELLLLFPDTLLYGWRTAWYQAQLLQFREGLATIDSISHVPGASEYFELLDLEGDLAHGLRDYERARRAHDKASAIVMAVGDSPSLALIRHKQARLAEEIGDLSQALRFAQEVAEPLAAYSNLIVHEARLMRFAIFRAQGDATSAAMAFDELIAKANDPVSRFKTEPEALAYVIERIVNRGYFAEARSVWEARQPGPTLVRSEVLYRQGEFSLARTYLDGLLHLERPTSEREARVRALMARVFLASGDVAAAREHALRGVEVAVGPGESVEALNILARTLLAAGEIAAARKAIDESALLRVTDEFYGHVVSERDIVRSLVALDEKRLNESRSYAERAVAAARYSLHIRARGIRPDDQAEPEIVLAHALLAEGNIAAAERALARIEPRLQITQDRLLRLSAGVAAARVAAAKPGPAGLARAKRELEGIIAEAATLGAVAIGLDARLALGEIEIRTGDLASGRVRLAALQRDALNKGFNSIARRALAATR